MQLVSQEALLLLGSRQNVRVHTGQLFILNGNVLEEELVTIKNYLLNPVDSRFKDMESPLLEQEFSVSDSSIPNLEFFENYSAEDFAMYKREVGLAMEVEDSLFIQDYFKSMGRVPTETELKSLRYLLELPLPSYNI